MERQICVWGSCGPSSVTFEQLFSFCNSFSVLGGHVRSRDVQAVYLPLPHHFRLCLSPGLPQEVGWSQLNLTLQFYGLPALTVHPACFHRLLQEKYPSSLLARLSGEQNFLVPFHVLDLVYFQTVSWVGVYYCPLLPLIGTVILVATFYIEKVPFIISVMDNLLDIFIPPTPPHSFRSLYPSITSFYCLVFLKLVSQAFLAPLTQLFVSFFLHWQFKLWPRNIVDHPLCLTIWPTTSMSLCLPMSPVHCHAVLCSRAEDVPRIQRLCFIPLRVAARSPHGWSDTGHLFLPATSSSGHVCTHLHTYCLCVTTLTFNVNKFTWLIKWKIFLLWVLHFAFMFCLCPPQAPLRSICKWTNCVQCDRSVCGHSTTPGADHCLLPNLRGLRPATNTSWGVSIQRLHACPVFVVWRVFPVWLETSII